MDSYEKWKECLQKNMKEGLSLNFVKDRIQILNDLNHSETKKYVQSYGKERLGIILSRFHQLEKELSI